MAEADPICVACQKPITGRVITEEGEDMDPEDFCEDCHDSLSRDEEITRRQRAMKRYPSSYLKSWGRWS